METKHFILKEASQSIYVYHWQPAGNDPKGLIHIVHGMAEHGARYDIFAEALCKAGFAVFVCDLPGHGKTAGELGKVGFLYEKDGWMCTTEIIKSVGDTMEKIYPGKPVFMLGHSMGSFLARTFAAKYGASLKGLILSGTSFTPSFLLWAGKAITELQILFCGKHLRSRLLTKLSFGTYNKRIKLPETPFDWLSRDSKIADNYIADPYCGFVCTTGFYRDMFSGIKFIQKKSSFEKVPQKLPVFIFSGSEDPVGDFGKGPLKVMKKLNESGHDDVEIKIFDGSRHETMNEINKEEVFAEVISWLNRHS